MFYHLADMITYMILSISVKGYLFQDIDRLIESFLKYMFSLNDRVGYIEVHINVRDVIH